MKKPLFFVLILLISFAAGTVQAQLKRLSRQQIFNGQASPTKDMVYITGWTDDSHYIEIDAKDRKAYAVDVKSGARSPYTPPPKSDVDLTSASKSNSKKTLVWRDEFKRNGLPDSTKWDYEEGFIRNRESQYYTRARLENCYIKGGKLILESIKEKYKNAEYTSASINTLGKQQFEGDFRIEIRAKIPSGKGIWPALWMMGSNVNQVGWPKCFEFDIMEFVGKEPNTIHGTFHWWEPDSDRSKQHKSKGSKIVFDDLHKKYHVYGLERKGDTATVFVDDKIYFTMAAPANAFKNSFTSPVYLLMNTAIGGEWGGPVDDAIFPQKFYIDYVRVFKLE